MKFFPILLLSILTLSCSRTIDTTNNSLIGKWKLTQYLVDPGNGTGTWQPATQNQTYIQFNTDGTMSSDLGMLREYKTYEYKTDSTLILRTPQASYYFMTFFKITSNTLELNPTCIERCAYRFKRE